MFDIYLKNTIVHNLEYTYNDDINNLEDARIYCFFYKYDIILFFKKEKKFWFSKINPLLKFKFCHNENLCDTYLIYKNEKYINFNNEIKSNNDIDNKILFIIYGSLKNYNNEYFCMNNLSKEVLYVLKNDNYIYKLDNLKNDYYFITNENIDLNFIYKIYNIFSNIKNKKYKYVFCYNTDIIIPINCNEFLDTNIDKIKSNMDNEIIICNNLNNFLFCKSSVFDNFLFSKKYITIKPSNVILNDN